MVLLFNQAQLIILALIPNITNKVVSSQTGIRHNLEDNWSKVTFPTTSKSVAKGSLAQKDSGVFEGL